MNQNQWTCILRENGEIYPDFSRIQLKTVILYSSRKMRKCIQTLLQTSEFVIRLLEKILYFIYPTFNSNFCFKSITMNEFLFLEKIFSYIHPTFESEIIPYQSKRVWILEKIIRRFVKWLFRSPDVIYVTNMHAKNEFQDCHQ